MPEQRERRRRVIDARAGADGREDAERNGDDDRDEHRRQRELEGRRHPLARSPSATGSLVRSDVPRSPRSEAVQKAPVLRRQRPVEPEPCRAARRRLSATRCRRASPAPDRRARDGSARRPASRRPSSTGMVSTQPAREEAKHVRRQSITRRRVGRHSRPRSRAASSASSSPCRGEAELGARPACGGRRRARAPRGRSVASNVRRAPRRAGRRRRRRARANVRRQRRRRHDAAPCRPRTASAASTFCSSRTLPGQS